MAGNLEDVLLKITRSFSERPNKEEEVLANVERNLTDAGFDFEKRSDGTFEIPTESNAIHIGYQSVGNLTVLALRAILAFKVKKFTPEVIFNFFEISEETPFGRFMFIEDMGVIVLEHAVVGDNLDPDNLLMPLATLIVQADKYGEVIARLTGGETLEQFRARA